MKNSLQDCAYTSTADKYVSKTIPVDSSKYINNSSIHLTLNYLILSVFHIKLSRCLIFATILLFVLICSANGKFLHSTEVEKNSVENAFENPNEIIQSSVSIVTLEKADEKPISNGEKIKMSYKTEGIKSKIDEIADEEKNLKVDRQKYGKNISNDIHESKQSSTTSVIDFVKPTIKKHEEIEIIEPCVLGDANNYLSWWLHKNGSLVNQGISSYGFHIDLSSTRVNGSLEVIMMNEMMNKAQNDIVFLSMAKMNLQKVPLEALLVVRTSVHYLSLYGNNFFIAPTSYGRVQEFDWARFPNLSNLEELDLRNCAINYIAKGLFEDMPKLKKLYLAHNRLSEISSDLFKYTPSLVHLDISYNDVYYEGSPGLSKDPYERFVDGLVISDDAFSGLINIETLDFSKTKISPISARAFAKLGKSLKHLSLCYTDLPLINSNMFNNTTLRVLDLSGNPTTSSVVLCDAFSGLQDTLEVLFYRKSNVKYLVGLNKLKSLKILHLGCNIISVLHNDTFAGLPNLVILDLSKNHINNWYTRVFANNTKLEMINLRQNNINLMSQEMMQDFHNLRYLAIGRNNFVCNCRVRDFIDVMKMTAHHNPELSEIKDVINNMLLDDLTNQIVAETYLYDIENFQNYNEYEHSRYIYRSNELDSTINSDFKSVEISNNFSLNLTLRSHSFKTNKVEKNMSTFFHFDHTNALLNNSFMVIDYSPEDYQCVESKSGDRVPFHKVEPCPTSILEETEYILKTWQVFLIAVISVMAFLCISLIIYRKWFYLKYCFGLMRNALVLSCMDKEVEQFRKRASQSTFLDYAYDVFISYCDEDRMWVLDELLPNIEKNDISACLHERDFVVGMSILDNIVYCMDRSKVLLLVVSNQFLSRRWCQFEMHLAQYRLLETMRDRLILVLLETIPRGKRPKTLRYLMATKTYIQWPTNTEEQGIFWKRLKKALALEEQGNLDKSTISLA